MGNGKKWMIEGRRNKSDDQWDGNERPRGKRERRYRDRRSIEDEILALQEEHPGITDAAIREIMRSSDRDIDS